MSDHEDDSGDVGGHQAGDNSQIEVYGRLRPSAKNDKTTTVLHDDRRGVEFRIPRELAGGSVNNKKELYEFKMNHIFDETAKQQDVFDGIGKQVVQNVLDGFNGQTAAASDRDTSGARQAGRHTRSKHSEGQCATPSWRVTHT